MSPDDFDDLLAAHALDALDDADRQRVEARLADDPAARERYTELEQTVLAAAHELGPPDHVWDRLAGAVFPGEPRVPHPRLLVRRGSPRRRVGQRVLAGLAAAACVAALVTGLVLATSSGSSPTSLSRAARSAASAPGARLAALRSPTGTVAAMAVVLPNGSGYLSSSLPPLGAGRTYQLWATNGRSAVSLGVLGPDPGVAAFTLVGSGQGLAVTNEVAGGVVVSQQPPAAVGQLPSA
jgi:anti-sigma factor RsiW